MAEDSTQTICSVSREVVILAAELAQYSDTNKTKGKTTIKTKTKQDQLASMLKCHLACDGTGVFEPSDSIAIHTVGNFTRRNLTPTSGPHVPIRRCMVTVRPPTQV